MNTLLIGGGALLLLLLLSGGKEDEKSSNGNGNGNGGNGNGNGGNGNGNGNGNGGGYGKLPPQGPPDDPRTQPDLPGVSGSPKGQPAGNAVIPQLADPPATGGIPASQFSRTSLQWPDTHRDLILQTAIEEYEDGVLLIYVPYASNLLSMAPLEDKLDGWARLFGYKTVVYVYGVPEDRAYTAEVFYQGNQLSDYDLLVSYTPEYLDTAVSAGGLMDFFVAGLADWLHGPN